MRKVVVLTGAGMSAESGLKTFRDADGLWEGHNVYEVASPEGFAQNPNLVLDFYNQRRRQLNEVHPNAGHKALAELQSHFDVTIVTQNVDDLHERAGSTNVVHLHGELFKVRSMVDETLVYDWKGDLVMGDTNEQGHQLRPHIVWFGEMVPMMDTAVEIVSQADILLVIGTSLVVYPAAGLVNYTAPHIPKYIIDPKMPEVNRSANIEMIVEKATVGTPLLVKRLIEDEQS